MPVRHSLSRKSATCRSFIGSAAAIPEARLFPSVRVSQSKLLYRLTRSGGKCLCNIIVEHLEGLNMNYPKPTVDIAHIRREYHAASLA